MTGGGRRWAGDRGRGTEKLNRRPDSVRNLFRPEFPPGFLRKSFSFGTGICGKGTAAGGGLFVSPKKMYNAAMKDGAQHGGRGGRK